MNRREFVQALAGLPLLGLLARVPNVKEKGISLVMPSDPGYVDCSVGYNSGTVSWIGWEEEVGPYLMAMVDEGSGVYFLDPDSTDVAARRY